MRRASAIELDGAQREKLIRLAHSNTAAVRLARRASIVLLAADGLDNHRIGEILGIGRIQVGRWRERYAAGGLKAIEQDLPRGGRKPKVDPAEIVRLTTQTKPQAATQWSTRTLATVAGVSDTTIQRIWKARGLKPHRIKRFKLSRDPKIVEKLGLGVDPFSRTPQPERERSPTCQQPSRRRRRSLRGRWSSWSARGVSPRSLQGSLAVAHRALRPGWRVPRLIEASRSEGAMC